MTNKICYYFLFKNLQEKQQSQKQRFLFFDRNEMALTTEQTTKQLTTTQIVSYIFLVLAGLSIIVMDIISIPVTYELNLGKRYYVIGTPPGEPIDGYKGDYLFKVILYCFIAISILPLTAALAFKQAKITAWISAGISGMVALTCLVCGIILLFGYWFPANRINDSLISDDPLKCCNVNHQVPGSGCPVVECAESVAVTEGQPRNEIKWMELHFVVVGFCSLVIAIASYFTGSFVQEDLVSSFFKGIGTDTKRRKGSNSRYGAQTYRHVAQKQELQNFDEGDEDDNAEIEIHTVDNIGTNAFTNAQREVLLEKEKHD